MHTIGVGSVEGRPVFMDATTDSYFTVDPGLEAEVEQVLESGGVVQPGELLHTALGLSHGPARIVRPEFAWPTASLLDQPAMPQVRLTDVLKAGSLLVSMRRRLRSRPIHSLLGEVFAHQPIGKGELIDGSSRFLAARRFVPIRRNCLLDSLSLLRWLGAPRVSILFGVKLDPFAAHCWVQAGPMILNDLTENVAAFTVVRVV